MRSVSRARQAHRSQPDARRRRRDRWQFPSDPARAEPRRISQPVQAPHRRLQGGPLLQAAHRQGNPGRMCRRPARSFRLPFLGDRARAQGRPIRQGPRSGAMVCADVPRSFLPRASGQQAARRLQRSAPRARARDGLAAGRDQRLSLPPSGRRQGARGPALYPDRQGALGRDPMALRHRRVVRQDARRDGISLRRRFRTDPQQRRDRAAGRFRIRVRQVSFPQVRHRRRRDAGSDG